MPTPYAQAETYISQPQLKTESADQYEARKAAVQKARIADIAGNTATQGPALTEALQLTKAAVRAQHTADLKVQQQSQLAQAAVATVKSAGNAISAAVVAVVRAVPDFIRANQAPNAQLMRGLRGRPGQPYVYDRSDPSTDPSTFVEVVRLPKTSDQNTNLSTAGDRVLKYNEFFITDTQEVDAEKAEVSETFGAPHVFATGRYMRKVMISGVCRTGPVNPNALDVDRTTGAPLYGNISSAGDDVKARFVVPQTLGLRVVYDKALRASEQIARGLYSRLHVDGEVYSGWFTTLNISRSSAEEAFAHFTMSMLVFGRYHKDENWAAKLVSSVTNVARNAFDDAAATATLTSMAGKMTLKLAGDGIVLGVVSESTKDALAFKSPVSITVDGIPQPVLTVTEFKGSAVDVRGFSISYGNTQNTRHPLNGATTGLGTHALFPVITDFDDFVTSLNEFEPAVAQTNRTVSITVRMKPLTGTEISTLTVTLEVNQQRTAKVEGMVLHLPQTGDKEYNNVVVVPARDAFSGPKTIGFELLFHLQSGGGVPIALTQTQASALTVTLTDPVKSGEARPDVQVTPATGVLGSVVKVEVDVASATHSVVLGTPVTISLLEPATALIKIVGILDCTKMADGAQVADLRTTNPFASAKDTNFSFALKLAGIPGYKDSITSAITITAQYASGWMSNLLAAIVSATVDESGWRLPGAFVGGSNFRKIASITFSLTAGGKQKAAADPSTVRAIIEVIVRASTFNAQKIGHTVQDDVANFSQAMVLPDGGNYTAHATTTINTAAVPYTGQLLMEQPVGVLGVSPLLEV